MVLDGAFADYEPFRGLSVAGHPPVNFNASIPRLLRGGGGGAALSRYERHGEFNMTYMSLASWPRIRLFTGRKVPSAYPLMTLWL